jgi:hydrogenase maturation protease
VLEANYQFQVEDVLLFSEFQKVIVVDALKKGSAPFVFKKIRPQKKFTFTTHALPAEAVAYLTESLYGRNPEVYLLAIRGYEFEVGEGLTPAAQQNLEQALAFFKETIS